MDETSFRGALLSDRGGVLSQMLIDAAWDHKLPDAAIDYGEALLAAANAAAKRGPPAAPKRSLFALLGVGRRKAELTFGEQLDIVAAAGRWFVFWGQRGHPIRAWF